MLMTSVMVGCWLVGEFMVLMRRLIVCRWLFALWR